MIHDYSFQFSTCRLLTAWSSYRRRGFFHTLLFQLHFKFTSLICQILKSLTLSPLVYYGWSRSTLLVQCKISYTCRNYFTHAWLVSSAFHWLGMFLTLKGFFDLKILTLSLVPWSSQAKGMFPFTGWWIKIIFFLRIPDLKMLNESKQF